MEFLYRFQESLYTESKLLLVLSKYPIVKTTNCGTWINISGYNRFVLSRAKKKFACHTIEEALKSYHARKKRQISILRHQLAKAEAALKLNTDMEEAYF